MTRAVSLKLAAADQVPVQFSREASKLSRFVIPFQPDWDRSLGAQNQSRYDLDLRKHVSLSSDQICFAAKISYALEPLFRSYRIWRYLWFNYWTEARQNGIYRLNLRSPNMVDSVMQFLSQKSWEGLARTASVSAHAETDITCLLITNHRHFRFCARRDGNHLLVDHYQCHYRFCARKNGSWLVTNHRSVTRRMITLLFEGFNIDFLRTHTTRYIWKQDIRNGYVHSRFLPSLKFLESFMAKSDRRWKSNYLLFLSGKFC